MELTFTPPAPTRAFAHEQVARYFFVRLPTITTSSRDSGAANLYALLPPGNTKLAPISHVAIRDNILRVTEAVED
ncbi:hypothetical protein GQ600_15517 [Phytophthora cactorum]|nr:hypothetical protein GQ600_15517 [Phytophthora cactorum]